MGEKVLDTFSDISDEIADAESKMFGGNADYEIKAKITSDTSGAAASELNSTIDVTNSALLNGLSSLADRLITQGENLGNRLISAISNAGSRGIGGGSMVVYMGDISVSGVLDKDAAEQVRGIADEQLQDFSNMFGSAIRLGLGGA